MDFSEKDAARSKWRSTQRKSRGRGRGGRGAGSTGRSARARAGPDLGSNEDRYYDEAEEEQAGMAGGPVRRSQGADLAELLQRADHFDSHFYYRSRVNLAEEFGLPPPQPEGSSHQGLSIDIEGLAACLALLPRNQLLGTDAFTEDEEEDEQQEAGEEPAACSSTLTLGPGPESPGSVGQHQQQQQEQQEQQQEQQAGSRSWLEGSAAPQPQTQAARQQPATSPPTAAATSPAHDEGVDHLLSELLGEEPGSAAAVAASRLGQAQQPAPAARAPAVAASTAGQQPPAAHRPMQQQQGLAAAGPLAHPARSTSHGRPLSAASPTVFKQAPSPAERQPAADHDAELDFLLGLPASGSAHQPGTGRGSQAPQPASHQQEQRSLEDWLDAL